MISEFIWFSVEKFRGQYRRDKYIVNFGSSSSVSTFLECYQWKEGFPETI
jgi:hypothetical protein